MSQDNLKNELLAGSSSCLTEDPPDHFGLSRQFRESVDWRAPSKNRDKIDQGKDNVVAMLRAPEQAPGLGLDNRFVACSRKRYRGPASELHAETHQRFWDNRLANVRPLSDHIDFLKAGPVIWERMGLQASRSRVASLLGLRADPERS